MRLAQGPGEILSDGVSTHRGMAIKVLGAAGPMIEGHGGETTQDFVLATGVAFPQGDAAAFLAAMRFGDHVAKIAAVPASRELNALGGGALHLRGRPDAFREAVVEFFRGSGAEFDIRARLCADLGRMPVEDASVPWPEEEGSYLSAARLVLPPQDAYSPARQAYFDDVPAFRPAHSLEAHRPLGSLMRARLKTYRALSAWRHASNGTPEREPRSVDEMPG